MTVESPASRTLAPPPTMRRRAWVVTLLLLAFMLLNFADKAVLGFAGESLVADLGITASDFGLVQSAFFWLFAVGAIVLGALSTRVRGAVPHRRIAGAITVYWVNRKKRNRRI